MRRTSQWQQKTSSSSARRARRSARSAARSTPCPRTSSAPSRSRPRSSAPASPADDVDEVIFGQVLTAGAGQNPARQAAIAGRHPREGHRLGRQPGLRLGPAHRRDRHAADRQRRRHRHRGRRPGIDVAQPPRAVPARRPEDGRREARRHHDQGRPLGRLQRLPHGHHRRERGPGLPAHPRAAGRVRRRLAEQGRGRPQGGPLQGRDRPRHRAGPQGRRGRRPRRVHPRRRHRRGDGQAEARLLQGRHRDGRQRVRPQRRRRRASC